MLRIHHRDRNDGCIELKLKGAITTSYINSLRVDCLSVISNGNRLILDLGSVVYIDPVGVKFLKELIDMNVKIENISVYATGLFVKN